MLCLISPVNHSQTGILISTLTILVISLHHYRDVSDNQTGSSSSSSIVGVPMVLGTTVLVGSEGGNAHSSAEPIS